MNGAGRRTVSRYNCRPGAELRVSRPPLLRCRGSRTCGRPLRIRFAGAHDSPTSKRLPMSSQDNASALADVAVPMVIGVTSHRDIPEDEGGILRESVRDFFARLQREYPFSPLWVLSPLAEGGDQLVAEEGL